MVGDATIDGSFFVRWIKKYPSGSPEALAKEWAAEEFLSPFDPSYLVERRKRRAQRLDELLGKPIKVEILNDPFDSDDSIQLEDYSELLRKVRESSRAEGYSN